jgi:16S rRNA (guanine(527)-N(7))-methyltransferase RsmG
MAPSRQALQAIIENCGLKLSAAQYDQLWAYHRMLRAANAELNLTRIHNFENIVLKHYVDSLLVLNIVALPSPLIDMGSGPGLPGIPLKIARPEVEMILAEPRGARVEFLRAVASRLRLPGLEVHAGKISAKYERPVAGVITRAVATIPETLERVVNCMGPGGRMLFMKGPECADEITEAGLAFAGRFRLDADHAYRIPGTPHERRLVVYERLENTPAAALASAGASEAGSVKEVSSDANPTFKLCRELLGGRGIRKQGRALLAGPRPISEVLSHWPERAEAWLTDPQGPPPPPSAQGLTWLRLAGPLYRELDVSGTHSPLLLVRTPEIAEWSDDATWPGGCTLFVSFQDPENVGAVLRSASAFGVARVVLLKEAAHPFHPKATRASGPAPFQLRLEQGPSIHELASRHAPLIALSTDGPALDVAPFPAIFGLVPGQEGPGLPPHLRAGERRRIPIAEGVESLNAVTATAIALYTWRRQAGTSPIAPPFGSSA